MTYLKLQIQKIGVVSAEKEPLEVSHGTSSFLGTCTNYQFRKFQTARSRLYQSRFLRPNTHFSAFFELYKIHKPSHRSTLKIFRFFANFRKFSLNFRDFAKFAKICAFSSIFSRNFLGIAENPRKIPEIYKICRKFANFMKIRSKFPNFGTATTKNFGSCATTKFCS